MSEQETIEVLSSMFPGVLQSEVKNFLLWNTFEQAVDLMLQIYPQNEKEEEEEEKTNEITAEQKNQLILSLQEKCPELDDEICSLILDETNNDLEQALSTATATQRLYLHFTAIADNETKLEELKGFYPEISNEVLKNSLDAAEGDVKNAKEFIESTIPQQSQPKNKGNNKKQRMKVVLSENGPTSNIQSRHKNEKKVKKKTIPSIKGAQQTVPVEYQLNETLKRENMIKMLLEMFDNSISREKIEETLQMTEFDIDRSANILAQKAETLNSFNIFKNNDDDNNFNINKSNVDNSNNNSNGNNNNSNDEVYKNPAMKEMHEIFPLCSIGELEEVLALANNDLENASSLMVNRLGENPVPEQTLLAVRPDLTYQEAKDVLHRTNGDIGEASRIFWHIQRKGTSSTSNTKSARKETKTVDLHGMRLADAQEVVSRVLQSAKQSNTAMILFITGQGKHSKGHIPVLKPLVFRMCKDHGYKPQQSRNRGVVVCKIE